MAPAWELAIPPVQRELAKPRIRVRRAVSRDVADRLRPVPPLELQAGLDSAQPEVLAALGDCHCP